MISRFVAVCGWGSFFAYFWLLDIGVFQWSSNVIARILLFLVAAIIAGAVGYASESAKRDK